MAVNHVQGLYPGQLVLHVDDIAKILGRSRKAVSELIGRDSLPFQVKKVAGRLCVDIFQVAQWQSDFDKPTAKQAPSSAGSPRELLSASKRTKGLSTFNLNNYW